MKSEKNQPCCCGSNPAITPIQTGTDAKKEIRKRYSELAKSSTEYSCNDKDYITDNAGYTEEQLQLLPEKAAAASAGCGNPTALAGLKRGEVVLDLGSGGGIDVFLAAKKVGAKGKAIGVDMTPEMIDLARENARKADIENVEFRLGEIEHLPVADESVDVIISNCVINLSTEKEQVFKEAYRVLKKGGRLLVSDMMVKGIPDGLRANLAVWSACIGGAVELEEYTSLMRKAGFTRVEVVNSEEYPMGMIKTWLSSTENDMTKKERAELQKIAKTLEDKIKVSHAEISAIKDKI